jgi:hypothetical protein
MSDFGPVSTLLQIFWRKDTRPLVDGQEKLALSRGNTPPAAADPGSDPQAFDRGPGPPKFLFLKFRTIISMRLFLLTA